MLREKNSIITGANRGIGQEIVKKFAQNSKGGIIFACARKKNIDFEDKLRRLEEDYKLKIIPVYFDLSKKEQIDSALKEIKSYKVRIDVLVNNAGVNTPYRRFQMIPVDDYRSAMESNVWGHMMLTQFVSRLMMKYNTGSIVNISSIAGTDGFYASCDYVATKAAVKGITVQQARELGKFGIRVNAVAPGVTMTNMIEGNNDEMLKDLLPSIMLGRFGMPEEIANAVLFLASDLSSYITGQEIRVDGGSSVPRAMW